MPPVHLLILTVCTGVILYALLNLGNAHVCVECGGRGDHRPDCPRRR